MESLHPWTKMKSVRYSFSNLGNMGACSKKDLSRSMFSLLIKKNLSYYILHMKYYFRQTIPLFFFPHSA